MHVQNKYHDVVDDDEKEDGGDEDEDHWNELVDDDECDDVDAVIADADYADNYEYTEISSDDDHNRAIIVCLYYTFHDENIDIGLSVISYAFHATVFS